MLNWSETRVLVKVARMYYLENMNQLEIANKLNLHRTTISKLLKKAREEGIVNITISNEYNECVELENELEKIFDLKEVCVVPSAYSQTEIMAKKKLGIAAAELIKRIVREGLVIGCAWGTTMAAIANALVEADCKAVPVTVIPLVGGPGNLESEYHVNTICSKIATAFKAQAIYLYAPAVTADKKIKDTLIQDKNIKKIVELWDKVDVAVVGIGAPLKSSNLIWSGYFGTDDIEYLKEKNAVGDICSRFYDIRGNIIKSYLDDRTISIELEKLRNVKFSVGVAESAEKASSILGALRGRFINVLITNETTARLILELNEDKSGEGDQWIM
ncbi:sugar-binding transcriptional regulator [Thermoanaerobacterium sp. DL9XJH110]|uniref:sugar-binding transcriptional regulator n=1 Tax=Thermoanaerobacterium sp. DL9XJH110 TaxID=3386643 RepID=UPI003BB4FEAA